MTRPSKGNINRNEPWGWKKIITAIAAILATLAAIAEFSGYNLKDIFSANIPSGEAITLTIKVRDELGNRPLKNKGNLVVDYGNGTQTIPIEKEGKIDLREIPVHLAIRSLKINLEAPGFEPAAPNLTYTLKDSPIEYIVKPSSRRGIIKGMIRDETSLSPISKATITIDTDTTIYSQQDGRFQVSLPNTMQKEAYTIIVIKEGYVRSEFKHSPYSTNADIRLKTIK